PLHGPPELLGRPQNEAVLGILPALRAEAAADVVGDHPDAVLWDLEDVSGQRVADAMRILHVGMERVPALALVPDPERAARLHVLGMDARDDVTPGDHAVGAGERGVGGRAVAGLEEIRDV